MDDLQEMKNVIEQSKQRILEYEDMLKKGITPNIHGITEEKIIKTLEEQKIFLKKAEEAYELNKQT